MIYVVFAVVVVLGIVCLAAAIAGIASYNDPYAQPSFGNLMAGTAATAFGAAILLCAVYTRLPFSTEGYAVPIFFCLVGLTYLAVGGRQKYVENGEGAQQSA